MVLVALAIATTELASATDHGRSENMAALGPTGICRLLWACQLRLPFEDLPDQPSKMLMEC